MSDETTIKAVNTLLLLAMSFLFYGLLYFVTDEHDTADKEAIPGKVEQIAEDTQPRREPTIFDKALDPVWEIRSAYEGTQIIYTKIEYDYIGVFYITAYSDKETNSTATASGETVHYSDSNFEPTTCAIDRRLFPFYTLIAVGDGADRKVYITEDTGSAVIGKHVDVYRETLEEVQSFPTSYQSVWYAYFIDYSISTKERRFTHEWLNNYLHHRRGGPGPYLRHDYRAHDRLQDL